MSNKLSDIVDFNPSRILKKGTVAPFIEMASLPTNTKFIKQIDEKPFSGGSKFKNGDTLFARITPCLENGKTGKVTNLKDEMIGHGSTEFIVMSAKEPEFDEDYIYYFARLPEFREFAQQRMVGTSGRQRVAWQDLADFEFIFPPKEQRKKAAALLNIYDQKIDLNTQINQTLEQIAQALFKSWFVDFDPVRAKVQALSDGLSLEQAELAAMQAISGKTPKELTTLSQTQPERYAELAETAKAFPCEMVEVDGVEVPKGWEVLNANDVIEFNPKETLKKDTLAYYLDMASLPTQGCSPDLPILRKFTSGTRFRNGDTLFARITPCLENGKTAFIQYLPEGTVAWGSTEYIVMRTKGIIPKPYSYLLARYESFREYAIRSMTGTSGRQRTQLDIIETYKIVSPSDNKLWESFSKIINPIFETINSNTNKNITLSNIRDLLLPKLLNGEI